MRFRDAVGIKLPPKQRCVDRDPYWLIQLANRIMSTFGQKWKGTGRARDDYASHQKGPEEMANNYPHNHRVGRLYK